ncbi:MAG: tripartite tricarboxylate transporter substrate binding protein [Deltaproteobacteria bacterium]|jgi:tripartite-type tricarboxylate transporter receptor subunit TctC|nr:MAG: tripartite tricarboxylate transporter substrate binding protein [Deltaproteobacteria bacterium]
MFNRTSLKVNIFFLLSLLGLFLAFGSAALAQTYPAKPISLLMPWPAGGLTDLVTRALCEPASKTLGQPILVLNKPGGATSIALVQLMQSPSDGYTLGYITGSGIMMPHLQNLPYDVNRDFASIIRFIEFSTLGVVVKADAPWKTMKDLIEYARANPGKVKYTSPAVGNPNHIAMESLAKEVGVKWVHVPSKSGAEIITALLGGHLDFAATSPEWKPHVLAGKMRLLATLGQKRSGTFLDTPTLIDLGYKTYAPSFGGLIGPKGLPQPIGDKLHKTFKEAMNDPNFQKTCLQFDVDPSYNSPEGLAKDIRDLSALYGKFVQEYGLKKE